MRVVCLTAALVAAGFFVACREPTADPVRPLFSTDAALSCPTPAAVIVADEASLRAALSSATEGEVIGLDGLLPVTADVSVAVANITLTCATPGAGLLVAPGATVTFLVNVLAPSVTVDRLRLDGTGTSEGPYLALNDPTDSDGDGVTGFAAHARLTSSTVVCGPGECAFFAGTPGAVVADNHFESAGSATGVQMQTGIDGSRVERNTIVATAPSTSPTLGGLRVRDGSNVVVTNNVVRGPWINALAARNLTGATIAGNRVETVGPAAGVLLQSVDGVRVEHNTLIGAGGAVGALEVDASPRVLISGNAVAGSWVDAIVLLNTTDAQVVDNVVTCGSDECLFGSGARGTLVANNRFTSGGSGTGVQLQSGTNGVRVENNEIVATAPSAGVNLGGIRVRDGANVVIAGNIIRGPWQNGLALADLADSRVERNTLDGALLYGIRARSGGSLLPVSMTRNVFRNNRIAGAGSAGIFLTTACRNELLGNNVQSNTGNFGAILDVPTGGNVFVGNANVVIDDALPLDCDGDGVGDPNVITGVGRVLRGVPFNSPAGGADESAHGRSL